MPFGHSEKSLMKYWRKTLDHDQTPVTRYHISVLAERCKGCRLCIEFCPRQALRESPEFNSKGYHPPAQSNGNCLNCGFCALICPEFALTVEKETPHGK